MMQRLSRAGREQAIIGAIKRLENKHKYKVFTKGEIARKMGIKSSTYLMRVLDDMATRGVLISSSSAIDGYHHELALYGIPEWRQMPLPPDYITINGVIMNKETGEVI